MNKTLTAILILMNSFTIYTCQGMDSGKLSNVLKAFTPEIAKYQIKQQAEQAKDNSQQRQKLVSRLESQACGYFFLNKKVFEDTVTKIHEIQPLSAEEKIKISNIASKRLIHFPWQPLHERMRGFQYITGGFAALSLLFLGMVENMGIFSDTTIKKTMGTVAIGSITAIAFAEVMDRAEPFIEKKQSERIKKINECIGKSNKA